MLKKLIAVTLATVCAFAPFALAKEPYQQARPIHLDSDGEKWAAKTLKKLSPEE